MRILELGSYVSVAYAGMLLSEQGHSVTKWWAGRDPILELRQGELLWAWINYRKQLVQRHAGQVAALGQGAVDAVIDNVRPSTLAAWGIDPAREAERLQVPWVSLRADVGDRSFDALAQARSWMEYGVYCPFYVGDTAAGLWLAFKLLNLRPGEHTVLHQAALLEKLVEGELQVDGGGREAGSAWDERGTYDCVRDPAGRPVAASVLFRGDRITEPMRDREWKLAHFPNRGGRITV